MKKIFYEKRGNRYYPVSEYDSDLAGALPEGHHLLSIHPGGVSCSFNVKPGAAAVYAAFMEREDEIIKIIRDATAKHSPTKLTAKERKAHAAWRKVMGPGAMFTLEIPAAWDVYYALRKAFEEKP